MKQLKKSYFKLSYAAKASFGGKNSRFHIFTSRIKQQNLIFILFYLSNYSLSRFPSKEFVQRQECAIAVVQCDENDGGYRQVDVHLVNLSVYNHIILPLFYFVNGFSSFYYKATENILNLKVNFNNQVSSDTKIEEDTSNAIFASTLEEKKEVLIDKRINETYKILKGE